MVLVLIRVLTHFQFEVYGGTVLHYIEPLRRLDGGVVRAPSMLVIKGVVSASGTDVVRSVCFLCSHTVNSQMLV